MAMVARHRGALDKEKWLGADPWRPPLLWEAGEVTSSDCSLACGSQSIATQFLLDAQLQYFTEDSKEKTNGEDLLYN
jgi:hypothetical protein